MRRLGRQIGVIASGAPVTAKRPCVAGDVSLDVPCRDSCGAQSAFRRAKTGVSNSAAPGFAPRSQAIDLLIGRVQQRLELVEFRLAQLGQVRRRKGAEDQVDLLEAAPLRAKQKPFAADFSEEPPCSFQSWAAYSALGCAPASGRDARSVR